MVNNTFNFFYKYLQQDVSCVMHHEDQGADPEDIDNPRQAHQDYGGDVMYKHLPKVLPLHVKELGNAQRPVERHGDHVVPPNVHRDGLVRKVGP